MQTDEKASKPSISEAIVIGGGIGGLTLARACLDVGIEVEVYEKRQLEDMLSGLGGIFIQRNAMRVYDLLWSGKISKRLYAIAKPLSSRSNILGNTCDSLLPR